MRLSAATAGSLPDWVRRPTYDRAEPGGRIVHLGIGAFHRAHQAVYTDDAMEAGDRNWRITGVSLRSPAVRDAMAPQDGLYTVLEKGDGERLRLIASVDRMLIGPEDPAAVVAAIADPATAAITLTVTEKGYFRNGESGNLLLDAPEVAADLRGDSPRTIYGYIAWGLILRRLYKGGGLTLLSCDNLPGNGRLLERLLTDFLDRRDRTLGVWAKEFLACPNTMVDRIVPATTRGDIDRIEARTGVRDEALVVTEPFRQWVIEDRFAGPRPHWEAGGAQFVEDVVPFELAKLRVLNGSHSTLAYIGRALGCEYVHEAIADPDLRRFVRNQLDEETVPGLGSVAGLNSATYCSAILARFENEELPHRLSQIAMDGSQKVPQRWLATIAERAARHEDSAHHLLSLTAWIAYTRGRTAAGEAYVVDDPLRQRFATLWNDAGQDLRTLVDSFIASTGIFPDVFRERRELAEQLTTFLTEWMERGPRATLHRHLAERRVPCPQT